MPDSAAITQATSHKPQATSHKPPSILTLSRTNYHYEDFERERLDPIYEAITPHSEMDKTERYFLNGIIRSLRPHKILEVGVYKGGGSAIILNAISDIDGAKLYSLEYGETFMSGKPYGFVVEKQFPHLMDKWQIFRGGDASRFIEDVGGDIDMLILDTAHIHPWETLNFLCVLPFMKNNSWTVLHDITLHYANIRTRSHLACRYLFGHVVSDEKFSPASDYEDLPSNIGAFKVSEITRKYVNNIFESLLIPWESKVSQEDWESMCSVIEKYYSPEQYKFFREVRDFQDYLALCAEERIGFNERFRNFVYAKLSQHPKLHAFLRKVKHPLRKQHS